MKKFAVILAFIFLALVTGGCGQGVRIEDEMLRISLGQEQTLRVSAPKGEKVTFSSMDPNIASVDENGCVKALGNGITVITAETENDFDTVSVVAGNGVASYIDQSGNKVSSLSAQQVDETLISGESDITALALSIVGGGSGDVTISTGRDYDLRVTKTPADSIDKVTLRVADSSVARVEGSTLIGVARGKTTITATAPNGVSAEMIVRVK